METNTLSSALGAFTPHKEFATEKDSNEHRSTKIFIPNLLARWPWRRRINPHHAEVARESVAWIASFAEFSSKVQQAFVRGNFSKAFHRHTLTRVLT